MSLTEEQIAEAQLLYKNGWTLEKLAERYGVGTTLAYHTFTPKGIKAREAAKIRARAGEVLARERERKKLYRQRKKLEKENAK